MASKMLHDLIGSKMDFRLGRFLFLMNLMFSTPIFANQESRIDFIRSKLAQNESAIFIEKGRQIILIGEITPTVTLAFKKGILEDRQIKLVRIDSPGGDLESALEIATVIKSHQLNLIVDGKCFSACANYLFPAAANKIVLPGSLVAIHEKTFWYFDSRYLQKMPFTISNNKSIPLSSKKSLADLKKIEQKEAAFFKELEINQDLHDSFLRFLENRDRALGIEGVRIMLSNQNCREIRIWALSESQLISMGVKGIRGFWFPSNFEERSMLYKYFQLPLGSIYFGEARDLEKSCLQNKWNYHNFLK